MNNPDRLEKLLASLGMEILAAEAGSNQGQFPILDLIGNIRDEAKGNPALQILQARCAGAWERVVGIVETGKLFTEDDITWLSELLRSIQLLAQPAAPAPANPVPAKPAPAPAVAVDAPAPPAAPPAATPPAAVDGEDPSIVLNIADDGDLLHEFITESREHLDNIEQGVLVLEHEPADAEMLNTVFRAFHTFKGGAGFLNLIPINRLAHVLESLLDLARQGQLTLDAPVIELILRGRDVLKRFLDEIEGQTNGKLPAAPISVPTSGLKAEVQLVIDRVTGVTPAPAALASQPAPVTPTQIKTEASARPVVEPVPAPEAPRAQKAGEHAAMIKVDTGKLDALLDMVGEMVIAQSLVGQNMDQITDLNPQFARDLGQLGRITKELQRVSMSLRMVPIRGVFQKMARVVRDLGAKQQKKVDFQTHGEDTELDRGVVEELADPLLHMIRNSMDHGIETPEKRIAAGKSAVGTLSLRASHQGGNVVVEVEDDGAGLNRERILSKAIERGLTTPDAQLTDAEIYSFIFAAGFSTAEKVTDLSGRGVGLDVARRNVERLRGSVSITSTPGRGACFTIRLPLTLAIIDGLIVKVGNERYIIPTLSVRESFRPKPEMISRLQGRSEVVNVRGRLIPLLRLHELFGVKPKSEDPIEGIVVVTQSGADLRCLLVDELLHKQEVVIKNLNEMMVHKNRALAGAAILGDGRVGLILDVNALVHLDTEPVSQAA